MFTKHKQSSPQLLRKNVITKTSVSNSYEKKKLRRPVKIYSEKEINCELLYVRKSGTEILSLHPLGLST